MPVGDLLSWRSGAVASDAGCPARPRPFLGRRLLGEFLGTFFLSATVVGSGIAAQRLSPGQPGLELLENAVATGAVLVALILALAPVSGAHLNPVVSLVDRILGGSTSRETFAYACAQTAGAVLGAMTANTMFSLAALQWSTKPRSSGGLWLAEGVATFGLVFVIFGMSRRGQSRLVSVAVGCYITAAYFFTSSTSFANPALAVGRMFTDTFAGIRPASAPGFILAEVVGALVAVPILGLLVPAARDAVADGSPSTLADAPSALGQLVEEAGQ